MPNKTKHKVFAYIVRQGESEKELLVFKHHHFPEAGIQVPAGTIEKGEQRVEALVREVEEESGLSMFASITYLGRQQYRAESKKETHERYFYQLEYKENCSNKFQHIVNGNGEDLGLVFDYEWIPISQLPTLIAEHDYFLAKL